MWCGARGSVSMARPVAEASPASVWEEEEGAGWAKKAEWASCFRGRKKKLKMGGPAMDVGPNTEKE
jgi:hypothetical protein